MARSTWVHGLSVAIVLAGTSACSSSPAREERCASQVCAAQPPASAGVGNQAGAGTGASTLPLSGGLSNPSSGVVTPAPAAATDPHPTQPTAAPPAAIGGASAPMPVATPAPMREALMIDDCGPNNPAGLDAQAVASLTAGGTASAARWLYPYEGTVFPRGMLAPTLMWDGVQGDVVYVHISAALFDYRGCLRVTGPQQLQLPQDVWKKAGDQTLGPKAPFTVEVTVQGASGAVGPMHTEIVIAQATLKGSIFYNSYVSQSAFAGSVYRIPPGGNAEVFLGGDSGCYGCHSVSANGTHLIASYGGDPGASYALSPMTSPNPSMSALAPQPSFVGLSPDGAVYVNSALPATGRVP